jgi:hypothetical protein
MSTSLLFPGFDLPDDPIEARRYELSIALVHRRDCEEKVQEAVADFFASAGTSRTIGRIVLRRCIVAYRQAAWKRDTAWDALYHPSVQPEWHAGYAPCVSGGMFGAVVS